MKYKIGYLDCYVQGRINFQSAFEDSFEIKIIEELELIQTVSDLRGYVKELELDAMVLEFNLSGTDEIPYNGNDVVEEFSSNKKYFPVIILSSHIQEAIVHTDNVFQIFDKTILGESDTQQLQDLKLKIAQAISNYRKKVSSIEEQVQSLEQKQKRVSLTNSEEERLTGLYLELKAINPETTALPINLLNTGISHQLSELVKITREIIGTDKQG